MDFNIQIHKLSTSKTINTTFHRAAALNIIFILLCSLDLLGVEPTTFHSGTSVEEGNIYKVADFVLLRQKSNIYVLTPIKGKVPDPFYSNY